MPKSNLRNILLITIPTLAILFLILELALRLFFPTVNILERTGQKPAVNPMSEWAMNDPYAAYAAKPGSYADGKTVNAHGFISTPEIELSKEENITRIVFLGGSSTAGTGTNLRDEGTWPWKTVDKLKASTDRKIDFINAALGGYSTFESYGRLWSRLRFFKPDIVVVNHGWNEMYYFNEKAEDPMEWRKEFDLARKDKLEKAPPLGIDKYIGWSQLLIRIRLVLARRVTNKGELTANGDSKNLLKTNFNEKGLKIFRQNLNLIKSFCSDYGIQLYVCKQPTLISPTTDEQYKLKCRYEYHGFDHDAHLEAFNAVYKIIDEEIPKNSIIDLTDLSGIGKYFYDHIHPTEFGADEISDRVKVHIANDFFLN